MSANEITNSMCKDRLKIVGFGPSSTYIDSPFNIQPNGLSAFWFEVECNNFDGLVVKLDGYCLKTVLDGKILTALVPDELLSQSGVFILSICSDHTGESLIDLDFDINGDDSQGLPKLPRQERQLVKKPNFFIIGAPRSGTTYLSRISPDIPSVSTPSRP